MNVAQGRLLRLFVRNVIALAGLLAAPLAAAQAQADAPRGASSAFTWFVVLGVLAILAALFVVLGGRARARKSGPPPTQP
jgi:hypothetical protein